MIQFNLLPDVKLEYIKARRTKRTVMMTSVLVGAASLALFVLLFVVVNFVQKEHLSNLNADIDKNKSELKAKPGLAKILTIQNQLNSLPELHKQKPVASRVLGYAQQLTPQNVSISTLTVNFTDQTLRIEGSADSLATVNTFVDTLKFTNYTTTSSVGEGSQATAPSLAFSNVVLANFAITSSSATDKNKAATYSITLKYDPIIFSSDKEAQLQVVKKITTRSETEKPAAVFQAKPTEGTN
jgi:Tfp pilus assembly protein PilN